MTPCKQLLSIDGTPEEDEELYETGCMPLSDNVPLECGEDILGMPSSTRVRICGWSGLQCFPNGCNTTKAC